MSDKRAICLIGPTGVGKSEAGLLLAKELDGEIVSCDAMQVYREVNIACDKPSPAMRQSIPHHMIDVASVMEEFNVSQYRQMASDIVKDIITRGKTPIIVGGSGMYVNVLLDGIFEGAPKDKVLRLELETKAKDPEGLSAMHKQLRQIDPLAAKKIHPNDAKRIIRALEVVMTASTPISALQPKREGIYSQYNVTMIGLNRERWQLYRRVEERIDRMIEQGLVEEVRKLNQLPLSRTAATLIGIPEVTGYLNKEYDLERAKYLMKLNTRHFVKRQLTWFKRDERIRWIEINANQTIEDIRERIGQVCEDPNGPRHMPPLKQ